MSDERVYRGWLGQDASAAEGNMVWKEYKPKPWSESDVEIRITHCGICGSDIHTLRSGWGPTRYPCCVGHEIVGIAIRIGQEVKKPIRVGDRVGVGAQASSCLKGDCAECEAGLEQYCPRMVGTYNGKYPDGTVSMGGYANYIRVPGHFVVRIPDALGDADAAPMLCGGITVFSPLKKNGAGPGKSVGIVGVGGIGHFGLLFSRALGCDKVVAISRTGAKRKDAEAMGADVFIATDEEKDWAKKHSRSLDLIVSTVSSPKMPLQHYLRLLKTNGQFIQIGAPEEPLPALSGFSLIGKGVKVGGSQIGSPQEIQEMLGFAAEKRIKPWVQQRPMHEANQAVVDMENGKARYRYVLVHESNAKL